MGLRYPVVCCGMMRCVAVLCSVLCSVVPCVDTKICEDPVFDAKVC